MALNWPLLPGAEDAGPEPVCPGPHLVEVAMRALSPGINDPYTAVSVIDRLGTALCELVNVRLPTGRHVSEGRIVLTLPAVDYDGLTNAMVHPLRQSAAGNSMVLIRLLEVLDAVASIEGDSIRRAALQRHANLIMVDGERTVVNASDASDLRQRYLEFCRTSGGTATAAPTAA